MPQKNKAKIKKVLSHLYLNLWIDMDIRAANVVGLRNVVGV